MHWRPTFPIGRFTVGQGRPCFIIAEIGSNHDGSLERAKEMLEAAAKSGADAVKFQLFSAQNLVVGTVATENGERQPNPVSAILDGLSVPLDWLPPLFEEAKKLDIVFLATPFDEERLAALIELGAPAIKIASGDLTHLPLLRATARTGLPVLLSCGMSEESDVAQALTAISDAGADQAAILHCVSLYPPDDTETNLSAIPFLGRKFKIPVGFSDHGPGPTAAVGAVALGASVIEKHFTLDRSLPGPDHPFAMEPQEFSFMTREIRRIETMLGDEAKPLSERERLEQRVGRRSLTATRPLKAGQAIAAADVKCVRPGGGMPPAMLEKIVGRVLRQDLDEDEMFEGGMFEGRS